MPQEEFGHSEPEYKFNDEEEATYVQEDEPVAEGVPGSANQEKSTSSLKEKFSGLLSSRQKPKGRLIVGLVVLVVFLVVIYKISSIRHVAKMKKTQRANLSSVIVNSVKPLTNPVLSSRANMSQEKVASELQPKLQPTIQPVPKSPEIVTPPTAQEVELDSKILKLQKTSEQLSDAVREQQTEMQMRMLSLEQKLASLSNNLEQLQDSMDDVSMRVKENKELETNLINLQKSQKASKERQIRQIKQFFVQAVIPGRAWLHASDGSSLTITVGDEVPGYGRVMSIDAYSGTVVTSSGIQIQYGMDG